MAHRRSHLAVFGRQLLVTRVEAGNQFVITDDGIELFTRAQYDERLFA